MATNTQVSIRHAERVPSTGAVLVISNHRSFLDPLLVMDALDRSVRFACHHYMSQVPGLKEIVSTLGCIPIDAPGQRRPIFFEQAINSLQAHQPVGIFPEGANSMLQVTSPKQISQFHRGFAHLALRAPVQKLAILPVGISALEETISPLAPLKLFNLFAPSEPLFDQPGWHPSVNYHRVNISIGNPIWITDSFRARYQGSKAGRLTKILTQACNEEIKSLLHEGFA